ncbi:MAG: hypothetical protein K2G67_02975 [Muribaculaceae bacterium]|nr:hypothetical protein [Muribaculaceae bacterium]
MSLSRVKSSAAFFTKAETSVAQYCMPQSVADFGVEPSAHRPNGRQTWQVASFFLRYATKAA